LAFQVSVTLASPPAATTLAGASGAVVSGALGGADTSKRSNVTNTSAAATVKARMPAFDVALKNDGRLALGMV